MGTSTSAIDWKFVSPQILHVEILILSVIVFRGGAFGKWLSHKDGALMNGISALMKDTWESSFTPFYHVNTQQEDSYLWIKKQFLTRPQICQCLDLGSPILKNYTKINFCYK